MTRRSDATCLYKMGHRYYDPALGRFTQQDPIHDPLDPKQWNRYLYVGGDPANWTDPSGLSSCKDDWWNPGGWVDCAAKAGRAVGGFAKKCVQGGQEILTDTWKLLMAAGAYSAGHIKDVIHEAKILLRGGVTAFTRHIIQTGGKTARGRFSAVGFIVASCAVGHT